MSKFKALLLTQGMHGMISQVEGLAKALDLSYKHQTVELKKIWEYVPPKFTPITLGVLKNQFIFSSKVIISCGRKSVIPSLALKKKYKDRVFNIHIQDPKVPITKFDLIVCPEHDNLQGENVIKTVGAVHYLTNSEIQKNREYINVEKGKKKIVSFILGGPNKYYNFSDEQINFIFNKIKVVFTPQKYRIIVLIKTTIFCWLLVIIIIFMISL